MSIELSRGTLAFWHRGRCLLLCLLFIFSQIKSNNFAVLQFRFVIEGGKKKNPFILFACVLYTLCRFIFILCGLNSFLSIVLQNSAVIHLLFSLDCIAVVVVVGRVDLRINCKLLVHDTRTTTIECELTHKNINQLDWNSVHVKCKNPKFLHSIWWTIPMLQCSMVLWRKWHKAQGTRHKRSNQSKSKRKGKPKIKITVQNDWLFVDMRVVFYFDKFCHRLSFSSIRYAKRYGNFMAKIECVRVYVFGFWHEFDARSV